MKEEGDMHGSDIHQEACENKVMLHENELENANAIEFSNGISMVENTNLSKMDDKEVCTQVSYDSMDASNASYHSTSMGESSDDESIYVSDTHSLCDDASSSDKAHNMYVGVDAIEEADLATSKYAMFLDDSMNDALGVVMDDVKEGSCQVLLPYMMWKSAMDYVLQEACLCLVSHAFYMVGCVHMAHILVMICVDDCFVNDEDLDWRLEEPHVEMDDEMKVNVAKAMKRIDAMRDAKKDDHCALPCNEALMDDLETMFEEYWADFSIVYDVDDVYEHTFDDDKSLLFDPDGKCGGSLVDWDTYHWPFDPGGYWYMYS